MNWGTLELNGRRDDEEFDIPEFLHSGDDLPLLSELPQGFRHAFGGRSPKDWQLKEGENSHADDVARSFESWALQWIEPTSCPRCMWYVTWDRALDGTLVLTTEYGQVACLWSHEASDADPFLLTLLLAHPRGAGTGVELVRVEIDALGRTWYSGGRRRVEWERTTDGGWDEVGLDGLLAIVFYGQRKLRLKSAIGPAMFRDLLDQGIPAVMGLRMWQPLAPDRRAPVSLDAPLKQ